MSNDFLTWSPRGAEVMLAQELIPAAGRGFGVTVQYVGVEVDTVRPADGAGDLIDGHLSEVRRIVEWFEYATAIDDLSKVKISDETIIERQPKSVIAQWLNSGDARQVLIGVSRLPEAFDRETSFGHFGQVPVREKLRAVKDSPFADQARCGGWQMTGEHDAVGDPDLGLVTRIERVKVQRSVVLLVHVDGDSIEG